jgi:hypothetical protein
MTNALPFTEIKENSMFEGQYEIIKYLYGMQIKNDQEREKKVAKAIEYLGDKYCLAKHVERKDG